MWSRSTDSKKAVGSIPTASTTILTSPVWGEILTRWIDADVAVGLWGINGGDCLIGFNTGVIVPPDYLAKYDRTYNFHGGSSEYPGRDPHHWAIYDYARDFGVTLHEMTENVDEGAIIRSEWFGISLGSTPQELRRYTEGRLLALFNRWAPELIAGAIKLPPIAEGWGQSRTRADLEDMLDLNAPDRDHRLRAFSGFVFPPLNTQQEKIK